MEFLVEFDVHVPHGTPASAVESRMTAEAAAANALAKQGILMRLWKTTPRPGESRALGLYRADSVVQLAGLLRNLPLQDWMQVTVTALEPHPNDPATNSPTSDAAGSQQ